jgi:hypothetical protein
MKVWINEVMYKGEVVWFDTPGGAAVKPIEYVKDDFYLGEMQGQKIIFHEDDVVYQRRM